jgi:hypothetical protein
MVRFFSSALLCVGFVVMPFSLAWAGPTPEDVALSEALFREGKDLIRAGKYEEACPKLAESQRLDPAGGTLITLGLCYEAAGKTATAWVVFGEALSVAERDKRKDRVKLSNEHLVVLEKKLSYLTVTLDSSASSAPGLVLLRDGSPLNLAALGTAVPVDPGKHRIGASAPGFLPVEVEVVVGADGDRKAIVVPALKPEPPPIKTEPEPKVLVPVKVVEEKPKEVILPLPEKKQSDQQGRWSTGRYVSVGLALVSVGALGIGGYFAMQAKSEHDEAISRCPASPCPDDGGVSLNKEALGHADFATGFWVGGGVGLATAAVVWLASPRNAAVAPKKAEVVPEVWVSPGRGFVGARVQF